MGTTERTPREAQAETVRASVDLIKRKLHNSIRYLVQGRMDKITGRVDSDTQHAIRILESRQRGAERHWQAHFGTKRDSERAKAEILINTDNGDLLLIGEKNHGMGRLDCRACDFEYDDTEGFPVNISLGRICSVCEQGVQHAALVVSTTPGEQIDPRGQSGPKNIGLNYIPVYVCDYCGVQIPRKR